VRTGRGRMWRFDQLWNVYAARDVRRCRYTRRLRCAHVHAGHVCFGRREVRSDRRWLRKGARLRSVHRCGRDLWRRRNGERMRRERNRHVQAAAMRYEVRSQWGWLWQPDRLRLVSGCRDVHSDHLCSGGCQLRSDRRWLRRLSRLRNVHRASNVRWRRYAERLRRNQVATKLRIS